MNISNYRVTIKREKRIMDKDKQSQEDQEDPKDQKDP